MCRIIVFVWRNQPTTREAIADHLAGTDAEVGRSTAYEDIRILLEERMIDYDETERIITPAKLFRVLSPHRGGVDVWHGDGGQG